MIHYVNPIIPSRKFSSPDPIVLLSTFLSFCLTFLRTIRAKKIFFWFSSFFRLGSLYLINYRRRTSRILRRELSRISVNISVNLEERTSVMAIPKQSLHVVYNCCSKRFFSSVLISVEIISICGLSFG